MTPMPRNPNTHHPIQTLDEYNNVARRIADEYLPPPELTSQFQPTAFESSNDVVEHMAKIMERVRAREGANGAEFEPTPIPRRDEPEDPWRSLGGGLSTLDDLGRMPAGRAEDITATSTHGRKGTLVTRVALGDRFVDVPVREYGSNTFAIELAKKILIEGGGTNTRRLKPNKK
ncbi:hypothetical protein HY003_00170 [Candidatus Saccharibacteria bacterium]|nr:hypothetical protein [Candidatus Saccharibacteria bacterium]MBI3337706.1 hypothetical protein [Candidatus Saccharibacteria bacterium]